MGFFPDKAAKEKYIHGSSIQIETVKTVFLLVGLATMPWDPSASVGINKSLLLYERFFCFAFRPVAARQTSRRSDFVFFLFCYSSARSLAIRFSISGMSRGGASLSDRGTREMASVGHVDTQRPQPMHLPSTISEIPSPS